MIKVISCYKGNRSSINFVDDRNRLVGFDDERCCCEEFGWEFCKFSSEKEADAFKNHITSLDVPEDLPSVNKPDLSDAYFAEEQPLVDSGKFKIEGSKDCNWLVLYNYHNGYYWHGFVFKHGDEKIYEGSL